MSEPALFHASGERVRWQHGGKKAVLEAYVKLHEGKIGMHWLWCVILQMTHNGLSADEALKEYGYEYVDREGTHHD